LAILRYGKGSSDGEEGTEGRKEQPAFRVPHQICKACGHEKSH
jgi:hypothetical protein